MDQRPIMHLQSSWTNQVDVGTAMQTFKKTNTYASKRNTQAELFIHFLLHKFLTDEEVKQKIYNAKIMKQKPYTDDTASDIWDHFIELNRKNENKIFEIWAQTTCYKGSAKGKKEPNKTYEIRETLIEALSVRKRSSQKDVTLRTIHFTVGSGEYVYDWFKVAKENTFDLSLFLQLEDDDIFVELHKFLGHIQLEVQVNNALDKLYSYENPLQKVMIETIAKLKEWFLFNNAPETPLAKLQANLLTEGLEDAEGNMSKILTTSKNAGQNIKKKVTNPKISQTETDEVLEGAIQKNISANPFISSADTVVENWEKFIKLIAASAQNNGSVSEFLKTLWDSNEVEIPVIRRLILRAGNLDEDNYIQDFQVVGVTEHNVYTNKFDEITTLAIIDEILEKSQLRNINDYAAALTSNSSKSKLKSMIKFERQNGTKVTPSSDYACNFLRNEGFLIEKLSSFGDYAHGFHGSFDGNEGKVKAYTNLFVVFDKNFKEKAFLKAKYFSENEFPRRCKEEGYIGLTVKYMLSGSTFSNRLKVPLLMYIDMPENFSPPEFALRRLISCGWHPIFRMSEALCIINDSSPIKR